MKNSISIALLLLFALPGMPQTHLSLSSLPSITIHLKEMEGLRGPSVFSHFEVLDERADTARIGIHTFIPTFGSPRNRQLVFQQPAAEVIAAWLNAYDTRPGAPFTALIVLRNLWLSDANYLREEMLKDPEIRTDRTHIRLKAEIYAVSDSQYIPILRFDSLQTNKISNIYTNLSTYYSLWDRDLTTLLSDMADSISAITAKKTVDGRRIRLEDILQFNRTRFDSPIDGSSTLRPGVYANFQEFKNNAPSIQDFEIKQEKKDKLLYIRNANGTTYYSHDSWGYCDGKELFVMRDGRLYPMWKEGKAFYFLSGAYKQAIVNGQDNNSGTASIIAPNGRVAPGSLGGSSPGGSQKVSATVQRIFVVDMDSGTIY